MDQSEADRDLSATQRLGLAAGSTIQGAAGFAGDIGPLADTLDVAGNTFAVLLHVQHFSISLILRLEYGCYELSVELLCCTR